MERHVQTKAVGFYWTLPVPWAGFSELPSQIDEAAKASRTIAYQRDLIRNWAKAHKLELVHEEAFLEIQPDRGTELVEEALSRVAEICRQQNGALLYVDFSVVQGWRAHHFIESWAGRQTITVEAIYPDAIHGFDPHGHFTEWRERQRAWTDGKAQRVELALARAKDLLGRGQSADGVAQTLNAEGLRSASGKPWTRDSVQKLISGPQKLGAQGQPQGDSVD